MLTLLLTFRTAILASDLSSTNTWTRDTEGGNVQPPPIVWAINCCMFNIFRRYSMQKNGRTDGR